MDFSKFKLEFYDILAVLMPGFALSCCFWILLRGWPKFVVGMLGLSATGFTAMLLISFPVGHLVQELGDAAIKRFRGERYFKVGRDTFWASNEGNQLRESLTQAMGFAPSVDTAFDFCLSRVKDAFPRRDSFLTTSDFSRSILVVGILGIPALMRVLVETQGNLERRVYYAIAAILTWILGLYLANRRMKRFREMSETPVFRSYFAFVQQHEQSEVVKHGV